MTTDPAGAAPTSGAVPTAPARALVSLTFDPYEDAAPIQPEYRGFRQEWTKTLEDAVMCPACYGERREDGTFAHYRHCPILNRLK